MSSSLLARLSSIKPPKIDFFITSEEKAIECLKHKIIGWPGDHDIVPTVEWLFQMSPEEMLMYPSADDGQRNEWYFFSTEKRHEYIAKDGYWKKSNLSHKLKKENSVIGLKQILVYHLGNGKKTEWAINEYTLNANAFDPKFVDPVVNLILGKRSADGQLKDDIKNKIENLALCQLRYCGSSVVTMPGSCSRSGDQGLAQAAESSGASKAGNDDMEEN